MNISFIERISTDRDAGALIKRPLTELKPGDVRAEGWLRAQLELMRDGMTGRLPEYGPFFKPEANGFLYPEIHRGWEEVPLWLRGYYPLAVLLGDEKMLKTAMEYINAVINSQDEDGWFGLKHLKTKDKTESGKNIPDMFPNMLLTDTLLIYYRNTNDERVITLLNKYVRYCLSLSDEQFMPAKDTILRWQKIRAGDMLEELYTYYRISGDEAALTLAKRAHSNILKSTSGFISTHVVDFAQRFAYDAIYSQQSKRDEHYNRSMYEYDKYMTVYGQTPRGLAIVDEQLRIGAIDPRGGFEPCGIVELAKNFYILTRMKGGTEFMDRTEDVMLNHFTACFTPDYRQMHYLTSSNAPVASNYIYADTYNGTASQDRSYQIFTPNNRCCGHNTGMGWPFYTMNLWQRVTDGGLALMLYAPSVIDTEIDGKRFKARVETAYPFGDRVEIKLLSDADGPLYFRVPAWCPQCKLEIDGDEAFTSLGGGFIKLDGNLSEGSTITLTFKMKISLTKWPGNGSVSVDRGPLTYSVRIKEHYRVVDEPLAYKHPEEYLWENYEILPTTPWNYGLVTTPDNPEEYISVKSEAPLAYQPFTEENAPIVLKARARRIPEWVLQDEVPAVLQQSPVYTDTEDEEIELIPLGCARLRMACLPQITLDESAERWQKTPTHIPLDERAPAYPTHYDFIDRKAAPSGAPTPPWDPALFAKD